MKTATTLSVEDVLKIRRQLAQSLLESKDALGQVEPLRPELLESAVHRQRAGFGGKLKYESVHEVAATLFFGLAFAHAFENGNKRTGG